nr:MAG TPA: hypothetical protein [Caudoviricetes sp.]
MLNDYQTTMAATMVQSLTTVPRILATIQRGLTTIVSFY